jgi:hypothetical protein
MITSVSTNTAASLNTNTNTASGFASLQIVTASCHGVLNTQFIAPSPKPDWFDDLNAKLDAAKVLANQWIDDIAPQLTASIPSHVIDYGTTYTALTARLSICSIRIPRPRARITRWCNRYLHSSAPCTMK